MPGQSSVTKLIFIQSAKLLSTVFLCIHFFWHAVYNPPNYSVFCSPSSAVKDTLVEIVQDISKT